MLAINADYISSHGNPEPRLRQIADAGFSQIHWCHHFGSDYLYSEDEIDQIARWLRSYRLTINDLHASAGEHNHYYSGLKLSAWPGWNWSRTAFIWRTDLTQM